MSRFQEVTINYEGIARKLSSQQAKDGLLEELINLRHRNGRLEPIGTPKKIFEAPPILFNKVYIKIWHHDQDGVDNYVAMRSGNVLTLVNMETQALTDIKTYSSEFTVSFIKRFMIVIFDGGMDRYIWKDNVYTLLDINSRPEFYISRKNEGLVVCDDATNVLYDEFGPAITGKYFAKLNENNREGYINGGLFIRAALRLFDGSYILQTLPEFVAASNLGLSFSYSKNSTNVTGRLKYTQFIPQVSIYKSAYLQYESVKDIVSHVVFFASNFEPLIQVNDDLGEEIEDIIRGTGDLSGEYSLNEATGGYTPVVNPDFKEIHDSPGWYKVGEYALSKILEDDIVEDLDFKYFYQDYATRETLTVDQFSHHELSAGAVYNYNSRLILGDVKTKFGDYIYFPGAGFEIEAVRPTGWGQSTTVLVRYLISIETESGTVKKLSELFIRRKIFNPLYPSIFLLNLGNLIGYPDSRASKIEVLVSEGNDEWYTTYTTYDLKKSLYGNYAYYIRDTFSTDEDAHVTDSANYKYILHVYGPQSPVNLDAYPDTEFQDRNRVQISELNNPFYFPAENSYIASTGTIMAFATNTEALSSGQFGEYPLIVFTTKGIWVMYQGQGDALFSSVKPMSGDVPQNADNIVSVAGGVVYTNEYGVYLIVGTAHTELTQYLYGPDNGALKDLHPTFQLRFDHVNLVTLFDNLSRVDAKVYMKDAVFGYNHKLKELVATHPVYDYTYVYSFESGTWHKTSESYGLLINSYPKLLCLRQNTSNDGVFDLSDEQYDNSVHTAIVTRPIKLDNSVNFNLIHRVIQRCEIETPDSMYAGFYVFGSNDLIKWQMFQGNDKKTGKVTDILCTRSHLKVKYFVFVFASQLKKDSVINQIEVQFYNKLTNKIR